MMTHPIRQRRGLTMPEMLIMLIILSVFAVASTRLFQTTMKLATSTANSQDAALRLDHATALLRADAWTAPEIAAQGNRVTLGDIVWSIEKDTLKRSDAAEKVSQWAVTPGTAFSMDGATLVLSVPRSGKLAADEIRMISQAQQLARLSS
jgi:Tfp pilus assembly protein PilV